MPRPVLISGRVRQRWLALGLRQSDLAAVLGVSYQAVSCWEHGTRIIPLILEQSLEALEWRALANHDPPEAAPGCIMLARSADRPSDALLEEIEDTVTRLDDAIAEQVQAFNEELEGSEWRASVSLPSSGQICRRLERHIEGVEDPAPHALEICRRTFAEAVKSARKHLH